MGSFQLDYEQYLKVKNGKLEEVKRVEDNVNDTLDLYVRVTALFTSINYVAPDRPDFLDLTRVEHFCCAESGHSFQCHTGLAAGRNWPQSPFTSVHSTRRGSDLPTR